MKSKYASKKVFTLRICAVFIALIAGIVFSGIVQAPAYAENEQIEISGEGILWSDSDLELAVKLPTGVPEKLRFIVGIHGEDDWDICFADRENEKDYFEYDEATKKLTLHGSTIFDEIGERHLNVYVNAKDASNEVVAEGVADVDVRESKCDYDLPWDDHILPEWDGWIDKNIHVWIENAAYPDGEDLGLEVNAVRIKSQDPDDGVLLLEPRDDGWDYRGLKLGEATLELEFLDIDGITTKTHEFKVYVSDAVYHVDTRSVNGIYQGHPGGKIELQAFAEKHTAKKDSHGNWHHMKTTEGLKYQWAIEEGADLATVKVDAKDPSKAEFSFKDLPEHRDFFLDIRVRVTDAKSNDSSEVRAERFEYLWASDEYYQIFPTTIDSNLDVGRSLTVKPELRFYRYGQEGYTTVKNASFRLEYFDPNAIDFTEKNGVITITRKGEWGSSFNIQADWTEDGRPEFSRHWYQLNHRDYWIDFKEGHVNVYEDNEESGYIELNKENLDGLMEFIEDPSNSDYQIIYTVGEWDDINEDWDNTLSPDKYAANSDGIRISGQTLRNEGLVGVNVHAKLIIGGQEFCDTWCWVEFHEPCPAGTHKLAKVAFKDSTLTDVGNTEHYRCSVCGKRFSDSAGKNEITAESVIIAKKIDIAAASIGEIKSVTFNGNAQTPAISVKYGNATLVEGTDYSLSYSNNTNAGTATVTVSGKGKYAGTKIANFVIAKANNPMTLKVKTAKVKFKKLKNKKQKVKQTAVCTVTGAPGALTWKKTGGSKKITLASNGNVTVKKGLKKGTYKIKVMVTAAGDANYNEAVENLTLKIKVK